MKTIGEYVYAHSYLPRVTDCKHDAAIRNESYRKDQRNDERNL